MATGIGSPLALGGLYPSVDGRYVAANGRPFTSVSNAESALNGFPSKLSESCIGLTVLVADENDPDYPKAKEYWVQPKGTTPETYGLVEKGAGTTDYTELENKPTINDVPVSGNKTASDLGLATAEQGGKADTAIQGVSVNGTEVTPDPTTKKVALTIENGKSAYQLYLDNYEDEHGSTDGALNEAAWLESLQGKSALQIYNETMNTSLDEAGFINVLKQNYPMEYVGYNQAAAEQSIGTAFAAIDQLAASDSTAGKLYLMPNNGTTPTGTELFVTVQTGATTYMWYRLGALSVPSNVLTEDKIVQNLNTGGSDKVPSATAVMQLAAKLDGVTATEIKQSVSDWYPDGSSSGYYDSSAVWHTNSNYMSARFELTEGVKRVRFLGFNHDYNNNYAYGFLDAQGNVIVDTFKEYYDASRPDVKQCDIVLDVPTGAKYLVCLYTAWSATYVGFQNFTEAEFYCYFALGDSVVDMIAGLSSDISDEEMKNMMAVKELSVTSEATGFIRLSDGKWSGSPNAYHGYVAVVGYRGQQIKVTNNATKETNVAFVTAIDTVVAGGTPSYVSGWSNVVKPADGELGGSQVFAVPNDANYMYVYIGVENGAMPTVEVVQHVTNVVEELIDAGEGGDGVIPVRLFPLWTPWHIRGDNGVVDSSGDWEMFAHPVKAGDRLRLTATKNTSSELALVQYGFSVNYPSVGDTITATAIAGAQGEDKAVELTAESDGWFVFSSSLPSGGPTWSYTLEMLLPLSAVVAPKMSKGLEYGMRELHFTEPLTDGVIAETYSEIHGLYDALETAHGEAFEKLSDILENDGSDNEIRLYRLGYKNFGGVFTGYDFENAAANGYYADTNDGGRSHEKKRILLDAGVHGNEKAAVYGLYYFCKSVLESNDPWAVYIKSNYVIDVIPIVSTKNYMNNSRTDSDTIDPNRNFGERTLVQVAAAAAFVDAHAGEYNLHVDCHNQSNTNAKSKCFVGCVRGSKGFEDMVEFARRFSGIARGNWGLLPWYKPHASGGTLVKVTDPMIVIQTNASSELVADNYKMTFPSCTRVYGAVSITMEAPRQLTNLTDGNDTYSTNHYDAAKLTADMLIELTRLADGAGLADGVDW